MANRHPLKVTPPLNSIRKKCKDFANVLCYQDIITQQLEKIFYWNPIYGTYSKYVPASKRISFKDFSIYPIFFLYEVLLKLKNDYGYRPFISMFELNTFLAISKNHSEINVATDRIIRFREYEEKYELEKLLNSKNDIDPRFSRILGYNKYFKLIDDGIEIKERYINEVDKKVIKFQELFSNKKLILFSEKNTQKYFRLLYSNLDLIEYHKN